jgi:hypothetical protein
MTYRINRVRIEVEIFEPFAGAPRKLITDYVPAEGDAFAAAAVEQWRAIYLAPDPDEPLPARGLPL